MNASVSRLTSSLFGAPTIEVKAACASVKRSLATSGVIIRRGGVVPGAEATGAAEGAQWRAQGPCGGDHGRGGVEG